MQNYKKNLKEHKFRLHLTALLLMLIPPIPMYFAAQAGAFGLIWVLVAIFVLGNLLVIIFP
jgi:membrane protein YqaA with SNARE-associated domain